jgi:predicted ATPase
MNLRDFSVTGYKSLLNFSMNDISDLAVLVGTNGSGKTSILEAIHLFFSEYSTSGEKTEISQAHFHRMNQSAPIRFDVCIELEESDLQTILGDYLVDCTRDRQFSSLCISASLFENGSWMSSEITLGPVPIIRNEKLEPQQRFLEGLFFKLKAEDLVKIDPLASGQSIADTVLELLRLTGDEIFDYLPVYIVDRSSGKVYGISDDLLPLVEAGDPTDIDMSLDRWIKTKNLEYTHTTLSLESLGVPTMTKIIEGIVKRLRSTLVQIPPLESHSISHKRKSLIQSELVYELGKLFRDKSHARQEQWHEFTELFERELDGELVYIDGQVQVKKNRRRYPLNSLGEGILGWLVLIWHSFQQSGKIVLIEEIESHLHPGLLKRIAKYARTRCSDLQIFMTTHSTVFLDQCDYKEVWLAKKANDVTEIHQVRNIENLKEIGRILGVSLSDVLMAENILFVEGPSDEDFYPSCARLMEIKLYPPRVVTIPMRGIGKGRYHLTVWAEVAKHTTATLFMVLDGDEVARKKAKEFKRRGLIPPKNIYNLKKTSVEHYYPTHLILEALALRYDLKGEERNRVENALTETHIARAINREMWKMKEIPADFWKVPVAEYVVEHMEEAEIDVEIRALNRRMDDAFGEN